jgi:hypothetical protein
MVCVVVAPGVSVNMPDNRYLRKTIVRCPVCECMTEMVARHEAYYGTTLSCCRCGDSWGDGERYPRPFARGWRKAAVKKHRKLWDRATHGPPPTFQELYPYEYAEQLGGEPRCLNASNASE